MRLRQEILDAISEAKDGPAVQPDLLHILITVALDVREVLSESLELSKARDSKFDREVSGKLQELMGMAGHAFDSVLKGAGLDGVTVGARVAPKGVAGLRVWERHEVALDEPAKFAGLFIELTPMFMNDMRETITKMRQGSPAIEAHDVTIIYGEGVDGAPDDMRVSMTFQEFLLKVFGDQILAGASLPGAFAG
jgi:hypothetical protein